MTSTDEAKIESEFRKYIDHINGKIDELRWRNENLVAAAVAEEREACAKVADRAANSHLNEPGRSDVRADEARYLAALSAAGLVVVPRAIMEKLFYRHPTNSPLTEEEYAMMRLLISAWGEDNDQTG